MSLSMIVAYDKKRNIGINNELPWHFTPADMTWFVKNTKNKTVVMGRKTYESIGRLLPNRKNVILTRDTSYTVEGAIIVHTDTDVLEEAKKSEETVIIGGSTVYNLFLPFTDKIYVTEFDDAFDHCDASFPNLPETFLLQEESFYPKDEKNHYNLTFKTFTATF